MESNTFFRYDISEIRSLVEELYETGTAGASINSPLEIGKFDDALSLQDIVRDTGKSVDYYAPHMPRTSEFFCKIRYIAPFGAVSIDYFIQG